MTTKTKKVIAHVVNAFLSVVLGLWGVGMSGVQSTFLIDGNPIPPAVLRDPEALVAVFTSGANVVEATRLPNGAVLSLSYTTLTVLIVLALLVAGVVAIEMYWGRKERKG